LQFFMPEYLPTRYNSPFPPICVSIQS
jgi:hypothetical protein